MFGLNQQRTLSTKQVDQASNEFEQRIGVEYEEVPTEKVGYISNVKSATHVDEDGNDLAALLIYFIGETGDWTKTIFIYRPYFYLLVEEEGIREIVFYLDQTYKSTSISVEVVAKEDLQMVNHLSGKTQRYLKLSFNNVSQLLEVRKEMLKIVRKNKQERDMNNAYSGWYDDAAAIKGGDQRTNLSRILDIREYDVQYHIRVMIDNEIRCSQWYRFTLNGQICTQIDHLKDKLDRADLRVMAFDIETTKAPLKFPDVRYDSIMMISYIVDGCGFLITNREVVGEDVQDFEYAPKPEYDVGTFHIFNEPDERALLVRFFEHIRETKPFVFTTFNGDGFDWPFVQQRAEGQYNLKMEEEIGILNFGQGEFTGRWNVHMDCLYWVKRDAYLPQGSHGLKMVTKAKLGYDPVELDPELMVEKARNSAQELAEYSVSDSVATYFLYMKMIHDFIFALCTIIPTHPDDVLRRGSGTLCENLLMAQAFRGNIIFPNKQEQGEAQFLDNKLIDAETYVGGHVECINVGVYRSDFPVKFKLKASGYDQLIAKAEKVMDFALEHELNTKKEDVENYDEIRDEIVASLEGIKERCPNIEEEPLIYHVDVAAMYPNIILSNRLQPVAIVNEKTCAGCIHNKPENDCKRPMEWMWRGDMFPLNKSEYEKVKLQLKENIEGQESLSHIIEGSEEWDKKLKERIRSYCRMNSRLAKKTQEIEKIDTVCMRENPFYVDTVRDFRDRRYEFKRLVKTWGAKLREAASEGDSAGVATAKNRISLYDSLQLAHKIILNSFYGYVMRRGARWYSMEMAAIVTWTGGNIIKESRALFDDIGMPLELDTDGIWTLLPKGFPENFDFKLKNGKKVGFSFPCTMCNDLIYKRYGNHQYQTLVDKKTLEYEKRLEMSVFFEIDGPYKCMLIPASTEENKKLKKRYAVFDHKGKMTEVKGFELKRRGELNIIKIFQGEVFDKFLRGKTLQECYDACGEVADRWYDILESQGEYVDDYELVDYIGESRVISKTLEEYGQQKSTSITCAMRLKELLGPEVAGGKGLNVKFIVSKLPHEAKVAARAIPTVIFDYPDEAVKIKFLKKWTGDSNRTDFDLRSILDWDYYKKRLGGTIQKIVTIPAALQKCLNPVPRIEYPDWLFKKIKEQEDQFKQKKMGDFFVKRLVTDIEDIARPKVIPVQAKRLSLENNKKLANEAEQDLNMQECPSPDQDFKTWLKFQKGNWRKIRKDIKSEKRVAQSSLDRLRGGNGFGGQGIGSKMNKALQSFIHNMDGTVLNSNWHVVSIEPTTEAGILRVWAFTQDGAMFNTKLAVDRTLYVNSKVLNKASNFKQVQLSLPRNRQSHLLYQWEQSEEQFIERFNEIKYKYLLSSNIEGVYGTQITPLFKALVNLGAIVKPIKSKIPSNQQALGRKYGLSELENRPAGQNDIQYMPEEAHERIYLSHAYSAQRHFFALFIQATKEIQFFVVNPATVDRSQGMLNLSSVFQQTVQEAELFDLEGWKVTNQQFGPNLANVSKLIDKVVTEQKQKSKGASLGVLISQMSPDDLKLNGLQIFFNEYPVLRLLASPQDSEFIAIGWIKQACQNLVQRFQEIEIEVDEKIYLSRYSFIPVCNLGLDSTLNTIDIVFGRQLQKEKQVLWYSQGDLPDLGGQENKNLRRYFEEELENKQTNVAGFYRHYTVEISIENLTVNTILQADLMKELQDVTLLDRQAVQKKQLFGNNPIQFDVDTDEFITCGTSFQMLKNLVTLWVKDTEEYGDKFALSIVQNLLRWLSSAENSNLYDPLLHRLVHKLRFKLYLQLLAAVKQLGCEIVHASTTKLLVHTRKTSFDEAEKYVEFLIATLKEKPLFQYLELKSTQFWRVLLYKDQLNFAGIEEQNNKIQTCWNVSQHLPEALQDVFRRIVGEFIIKVFKFNENQRAKRRLNIDGTFAEEETGRVEQDKILDLMDDVEDYKKEVDHEYITELIEKHFQRKLFLNLSDIVLRKGNETMPLYQSDTEEDSSEDSDNFENDSVNGADFVNRQGMLHGDKKRNQREQRRREAELARWEFPRHVGAIGSQYSMPALEFIKMICNHIFGLDQAFTLPTNSLKKNLLRLVHIKEFSKEVQEGIEPSLILLVPDVVCKMCQQPTDIDICRDLSLMDGNEILRCNECQTETDLDLLERRLLALLDKRVTHYQMQDRKCTACKMVANSLFQDRCQCTGQLVQTIGNQSPELLKNQSLMNPQTDIKHFLRLMRDFGDVHNMFLLKEKATQLCELIF